MKIAGRVEKPDRQLRMYALHLSRAIENFSVARLPVARQTFVGFGVSADRLEKIPHRRKKPIWYPLWRGPTKSHPRELSSYRLTFCSRSFSLPTLRPAVKVIHASLRKQAVPTVRQKPRQWILADGWGRYSRKREQKKSLRRTTQAGEIVNAKRRSTVTPSGRRRDSTGFWLGIAHHGKRPRMSVASETRPTARIMAPARGGT